MPADDDGENNENGSSGIAPPEGKTPSRGDSLRRLPRSAGGVSILKSRAVVG